MNEDSEDPVEYPIDGILDLHSFNPKDLKELIPEYVRECRARGILEIRIIHGKGIGNLRRTVHAILEREEVVTDYKLDSRSSSSWGATLATLKPPDR